MQIKPSDFIAFTALLVTVIAFVKNLNSNTRIARFRETVNYIEKKEGETRTRWQKCQVGTATPSELEEELWIHLGQMAMVSFLMRENVFEPELVYQYWWRYFDEPLRNQAAKNWIEKQGLPADAVTAYALIRPE